MNSKKSKNPFILFVKSLAKPFYFFFMKQKGIFYLKKGVKRGNIKLVIGASGKFEKGWTVSDIDYLNLLKDEDWQRFFKTDSIEMIMAEHVWEHLTPEDAITAAKNCFKYLKPGGHLRIAIPDGNHSNSDYIDQVKPGGYGYGSDDHKVLYTISSVSTLFESAGFKVKGLEYFDENNKFICNDWDPEKGKIRRSKRFDSRNANDELSYTSLIIDAIKE
jgi:predicted SAM-dependent methyltransferase